MLARFLIAATILVYLPTVEAADAAADTGWYATAMLSAIDDGVDRNVDDGFSGYHFGIGRLRGDRPGYEFKFIGTKFNADGFNADQQQWGLGMDVIFRLGDLRNVVPYALVGGGYLKTQFDAPRLKDDGGGMASLAIGLVSPLTVFDLTLRTELRARSDFSGDSVTDFMFNFGIQRALKVRHPDPVDTDGDGVTDFNDRCEDTPAGVAVDAYGCARSTDRDGDGVPDTRDMCGGTPSGATVDPFGCQRTDATTLPGGTDQQN